MTVWKQCQIHNTVHTSSLISTCITIEQTSTNLEFPPGRIACGWARPGMHGIEMFLHYTVHSTSPVVDSTRRR